MILRAPTSMLMYILETHTNIARYLNSERSNRSWALLATGTKGVIGAHLIKI